MSALRVTCREPRRQLDNLASSPSLQDPASSRVPPSHASSAAPAARPTSTARPLGFPALAPGPSKLSGSPISRRVGGPCRSPRRQLDSLASSPSLQDPASSRAPASHASSAAPAARPTSTARPLGFPALASGPSKLSGSPISRRVGGPCRSPHLDSSKVWLPRPRSRTQQALGLPHLILPPWPLELPSHGPPPAPAHERRQGMSVDLHRILSRPTLHGAWLTKGGSERAVVYCAMAVQYIAIG